MPAQCCQSCASSRVRTTHTRNSAITTMSRAMDTAAPAMRQTLGMPLQVLDLAQPRFAKARLALGVGNKP